jgi:hypothetical protein
LKRSEKFGSFPFDLAVACNVRSIDGHIKIGVSGACYRYKVSHQRAAPPGFKLEAIVYIPGVHNGKMACAVMCNASHGGSFRVLLRPYSFKISRMFSCHEVVRDLLAVLFLLSSSPRYN